MSFFITSRRAAVAGVATALAAGTLVGATTTTATAAAGTNSYVCSTAFGNVTFPMTVTLGDLPDSVPAGSGLEAAAPISIAGGPDLLGLIGAAGGLGALGVSSPNFALPVGGSSLPVGGVALDGAPVPTEGGGALFNLTGALADATAPGAGSHSVTMPAAFIMAVDTVGFGVVNVPCAAEEGEELQVLETLETVKNDSATSGKATKTSFKKGSTAKIRSKVTGATLTPAGKVVAKEGAKKFRGTLNDNGVVVLDLGKKLKPGKHKFALKYTGSDFHKASAAPKPVVVKVVR